MPDTDAVTKGTLVEVVDAYDKTYRGVALTGVEGTHDSNGRKIHDFPVVWVTTTGRNRIPWPASDVRLAPPAVPDDPAWIIAEMERLRPWDAP